MKVHYSDGPLSDKDYVQEGIFLCGPTPRDSDLSSWRLEALKHLKELRWSGEVYVPERKDGWAKCNYDDQFEWELHHIRCATKIVFWIPREMQLMPGLTTNVEFGMCLGEHGKFAKRVYYGRPENAEKCQYLDKLYQKRMQELRVKRPIFFDLRKMLKFVISNSVQ